MPSDDEEAKLRREYEAKIAENGGETQQAEELETQQAEELEAQRASHCGGGGGGG